MTAETPDAAISRQPVRIGLFGRLGIAIKTLIAMVLCLTPVTAVLVLGWFMRIMRRETAIAIARTAAPHDGKPLRRKEALTRLASIETFAPMVPFPGWWRGLWETVRSGLRATLAIAVATLPFGAVLLISWWAGWENSFNKGYEQAWVGPTLALAGTLLGIFVLAHLPMALAHHAAERRIGAIWAIGLIRRLIARVRWRYLMLTIVTVLAAAPIYLTQIVPTFIEDVAPGLDLGDLDAVETFAVQWYGAATIYLVIVLIILRRWSARLYARAALRERAPETHFANETMTAVGAGIAAPDRAPGRLGGVVVWLGLAACWLAFLAALYVAQFANHAWWIWVNHPVTGLPWIFRTV